MTALPLVKVMIIAKGYMRLGSQMKIPATCYICADGEVTMRPTAEFERLFEPVA